MTIKTTDDLTQMDYPRYDSYKDSGIDWLGDIPEGWDIKRLKYVLSERNERSKTGDEPLLMVSQKYGLVIRADYHDKATVALSSVDNKIVYKNDLVFNKLKAHLGVFYKSEIDLKGIVSPDYAVYKSKAYVEDLKFLELLFKLPTYIQQFIIRATGVAEGLIRLYTSELFDLPIPIPPLAEQNKILKFIDNNFIQIDQAITLKQQQIAKLEEYKQIMIQNAVTKGLNPDAPMKDSDVDWIGDIPTHWEVKKLKFISNVVLGKMICNEDMGGMQLKPYLKSKNIQWLNVDITSVDEMWFTEREMLVYRLKKDDLVLSEGGEVGKTCIWNNELDECYIQNSAHKVSFKSNHLPKYFLYQFFTLGKQGQFNKIVNRVSIGHLTKDKLINTHLITPPLEEQRLIVNYIEKTESIILTNIDVHKQQIDRLKEYKTILINQAVTGKIKVS